MLSQRCPAVLAACVFVFAVAGCRGGGGDGDGGSKPAPLLSISPTSASATAAVGHVATFRVTLTWTDEAAPKLDHLEFDDIGNYLADFNVVKQGPRSATLEFSSDGGLPVGEYKGTLNFYLCEDQGCRTTSTGSPFALPYTITITPPPPPPTVTPSTLSLTVEVYDTGTVSLSADVPAALTQPVVFGAGDPQERYAPEVEKLGQVGQIYSIQLKTLPIADAGTYSGVISLYVCDWNPCTSDNQVTNSAAAIPYTITVTPEVLLQPIPTLSGLPEWETHQGNAGHTGYVPVALNVNAFSERWSWTTPVDVNPSISPVTTGSGKAIVTSSGYFSPASVIAINESDGTIAWRHDFGSIFAANHPATWGGRVFVATSGHSDTAMWSFDLADGSVEFRKNFDSQWEHYLAPTVHKGYVYTNGGYYGGMYAFNGSSGLQRWFASLSQYDLWTPAVDDNYAYAYTGYEFAAVKRGTGQRAVTIQNSSFNWHGYSLNIAPVLPGDGSVVLVDGVFQFPHDNHLIRYNVAGGNESWRVDGNFVSNPVVSANKVYVLDNASNRLEARDLTSGALLWTWVVANAQETLPIGNLIVTDNVIFLSTSAATYAIDHTTQNPVWSTPHVGDLAMSSNGVLYIVSDGRIDAFNVF